MVHIVWLVDRATEMNKRVCEEHLKTKNVTFQEFQAKIIFNNSILV